MLKIIQWINIYLLLSLVLFAEAAGQTDTLKIIQLSDVHICNLSGYHPAFVQLRQHYGKGAVPLAGFLAEKPRQLGADAVIITGDLVDFYEAETENDTLLDTQIEQFAQIYYGSLIPVYLTLGNHDITSYWIDDSSKKESYQLNAEQARAAWIRNISCFRRGTYYLRSFPSGKTTYRCIFLDNGYSLGNGMYLDKAQLDWLEGKLIQYGNDPVLIFMHKYLPVSDLNADGVSFTSKPGLDFTSESLSSGLLRLLNENANIKTIFCGHGHRDVSEWLTWPAGHKILQVETAGFAGNHDAWRLIKLTEKTIIICATGTEQEEYNINID
jgi:3',5'-cyclic AMP phosphodiesterase CpdA